MDQRNQIVDRIKQANNILVTVSSNPSVDQLAACIGLTLLFNKAGKHATAVYSGMTPSIIEFLQPEKTLEKNTDSLRDFIIALDKSKADKLRYKVEDQVVRIFITPYRTSISEKDLQFSQGDFNVDLMVALGVHNQADLDQAITAHGRILHDATLATVNVAPGGELGGINWLDAGASSLSELCMKLAIGLDQKLVDGQIATAFLTGIVAETNRFSNAKTSPETMSISATLMGLGANQQLVATKLEAPKPAVAPAANQPAPEAAMATASNDGTLEIKHDGGAKGSGSAPEPATPQIHIDENGALQIPMSSVQGTPGQGSGLGSIAPTLNPAPAPLKPSEPAIPSVMLPEPEMSKPASESEPAAPAEPAATQPSIQPVTSAASDDDDKKDDEDKDELQLPPPVEPPSIEPLKQEGPHLILEPPTFGSDLTANISPEDREPASGDPLTPPHDEDETLLDREPLSEAEKSATAPVGRSLTPPSEAEESAQPAPADAKPEEKIPPIAAPAEEPATPAPSTEPPTPVAAAPEETAGSAAGLSPSGATPPNASAAPAAAPLAQSAEDALANVNDMLQNFAAPAPPAGQPGQPVADATTPPASASSATPAPAATDAATSDAATDDGVDVQSARDAVARAINSNPATPEPMQALNAQPLGAPLHDAAPSTGAAPAPAIGMVDPNATATPLAGTIPPAPLTPQAPVSPTADITDPNAPAPPVPPPMLPPVQL